MKCDSIYLIEIVTSEMKRNGYRDKVEEFVAYITSSESYNEALARISEWVKIN